MLERLVILSMLLATGNYGTAGATVITGGTHDIGGTISTTGGYVNATSNVILNATSNVTLIDTANTKVPFDVSANNTSITVNMNNYDFAQNCEGGLISLAATNRSVEISNAHNFNLNSTVDDTITIASGPASVKIQANNDINLSHNGSTHIIALPSNVNGADISISAGHNLTIITNTKSTTLSNVIDYVECKNSTFNLTAGNDILISQVGTENARSYPMIWIGDAGNKANFNAKNGNIYLYPYKTDGISCYRGTVETLHAGKSIIIGDAKGAADAVYADGGTIDLTSDADDITLVATYTGAGYNAGIEAGLKGIVNLHSTTKVTGATYGVLASRSSAVTFDKKATVGGAEAGLGAYSLANITIKGDADISATKIDILSSNGTVTLAKTATLSGGALAIEALAGGKVTATDTASAKKITGNIISSGTGSSVDVNFDTSDSYLTGKTTVYKSGAINLDFANGGVWNVTGDSSLTNLANNSTVNMRYTGNSTNETVTAANVSGNGIYVMNTDLEASYNSKNVQNSGDKLIITTSSSGNNILELRDVSLDTKLQSQGYLLLVEDQSNGSATFSGKDLAHGGIFKYAPVITTANPTGYTGYNASAKNWYLTGFEKLIEVSDNTKATLGLSGTRYANYFMDNDTLLKRLGELRTIKGEPEPNGIWARYRHGNMDGDGFSGGSSMVQVGYDKKTSNKRYTGLAFNHTSNTYDFDGGASGDGSQDALTVYNTWLGDKNHYFDIVGKIGKMRGYSTYKDSLYPEKGHYDSWYCSISGEYGRKNINDKNGWYYEPQAQLTLGRIRGNDYTTGLGTRVNMASITSLISRAGVTFGKEYNMQDANTHSNIYGKINWLHEFKGDVHTRLLDTYGDSYEHEKDYGGSWWNAGLGATINVNKNTHMYLDFERNFGGEITTNWIGQLGCQWTWK
jgi:outer membrane autotransporter protein